MAPRFLRFLAGEPNWSDFLFRTPPHQPDARMVYIGGCGLITLTRGLYYLFGTRPDAAMFTALGQGFVVFWSIIWTLTGASVMVIAGTGHRWPSADRFAAFAMLMLWWAWGVLFLVSGVFFFDSGRRGQDIFAGLLLLFTGVIIAAGVIQGLRKTHEIQLREIAVKRIRELEEAVLTLSGENQALREKQQK